MTDLSLFKNPREYPYILLFLLSFFPILNIKLLSFFSFIFFATSIFFNLKTLRININKIGYKPLIINALFYFLLIISLSFSPYKAKGFDLLIREISLLLFPLTIIYILKIPKSLINLMAKVFVFCNVLVVIYFTYKLNLIDGFTAGPKDFLNSRYFLQIGKSNYKDWHPTYMSINNLISIVFLIDFIIKTKRVKTKLFCVFFIICFVFFSLILNSRIIFFLTIIIILCYPFLIIKKTKNRMIMFFLIFVVGFLTHKISANNKLGRIFEYPISYYVNNFEAKTLLGVRYEVQKCSIELISRRPITGYGIGYEKKLLSSYCYEVNNFHNDQMNNYSSHNVYLSLIFCAGFLTFFSFLFMLINNFFISIKSKNLIHTCLLIIFIFAFLTENYLIRLNGVLLFSFINAYFYNLNFQKIDKKRQNN